MAYWGIALALGPCINLDIDPPHERAAYEATQKALSLTPVATERQRAHSKLWLNATPRDPSVDLRKLDAEYAKAMRELSVQYPDDLDAATLYAESLMDLHPVETLEPGWASDRKPRRFWRRWIGGAARSYTLERTTTTSMQRKHHWHPEWALASAKRLETLAPGRVTWFICPRIRTCVIEDYAGAARKQCRRQRLTVVTCGRAERPGNVRHDVLHFTITSLPLAATYSMGGEFAHAKQAADDFGCSRQLRCSTICL